MSETTRNRKMNVYGAFCAVKGNEAEVNRKNSEIQTLKNTIKTLSTLEREEKGWLSLILMRNSGRTLYSASLQRIAFS